MKIKKTKIIKEYSEDLKNRQRKCISKFKIKTDSWKTLTGEYIYGTNISEDEACFQARKTAVQTYLRNNFEKLVTNVQVINCSDVVEKKKAIAMNVPKILLFLMKNLQIIQRKNQTLFQKFGDLYLKGIKMILLQVLLCLHSVFKIQFKFL